MNFEWGMCHTNFTNRILNAPELPANDDCNTSFYQNSKKLLKVSAKVGHMTPHTPNFGMQ